jgi:Holliday junction resolvase RusA-like endonuclease
VSAVLVEQSKRVKPWRAQVAEATRAAMEACGGGVWVALDGPLEVHITFTALKPASAPKTRRTWPSTRHSGDLDKLQRSTFDGIAEAGAIADDSRIVRVVAQKVFPNDDPDALPEPGAVIRIFPVQGGSS